MMCEIGPAHINWGECINDLLCVRYGRSILTEGSVLWFIVCEIGPAHINLGECNDDLLCVR